jgi:hypothetical protein
MKTDLKPLLIAKCVTENKTQLIEWEKVILQHTAFYYDYIDKIILPINNTSDILLRLSNNKLTELHIPLGWTKILVNHNPLTKLEFQSPDDITYLEIKNTPLTKFHYLKNLKVLFINCHKTDLIKTYLGKTDLNISN